MTDPNLPPTPASVVDEPAGPRLEMRVPPTTPSPLFGVGATAPSAGLSAGESTASTLLPPPPPPAPPEMKPTTCAVTWLLAEGSPAIQTRTLLEIGGETHRRAALARVPYGSAQGWHLLMMQDSDGTWPGGMLTVPKGTSRVGVGTIVAYQRLIELGWDPESPALATTKRLLFRLLAEDDDPSYLHELTPAIMDEAHIKRGRLHLREAAAAALAQAGYENDPRLRGAARRLTDRLGAYLRSPLAQKPWVRVGNQHVLPEEVAAPSFHTIMMLAYMPLFRSEHHEVMDRLYPYLTQSWPRQAAIQYVGDQLVEQPQLVLGDFLATRNSMDADMPAALAWLELMARLGFLKRHEGWLRLFDRLLDDRDRKGIWHPPRSVVMPDHVPSWAWPVMPLDDHDDPAKAASIDVTFRLGLIARLSGREVELL